MFFLFLCLIFAKEGEITLPKRQKNVRMGVNYFLTHIADITQTFKHKNCLGIPMYFDLNASLYAERLIQILAEFEIDTADILTQHFNPYLEFSNDTVYEKIVSRIIIPEHRLPEDEIFSTPFYEQTAKLKDQKKNKFFWLIYVDFFILFMLSILFLIYYSPRIKVKTPLEFDKFYNAALVCSGLSFIFMCSTWSVFSDIKRNIGNAPQYVAQELRHVIGGIEEVFPIIDLHIRNLGDAIDGMEAAMNDTVTLLSNTLKTNINSITSMINSNDGQSNPFMLFEKGGTIFQKLEAINKNIKIPKESGIPQPEEILAQINAVKNGMLNSTQAILEENEEVDFELKKLNRFFKRTININSFKGLSPILPKIMPTIQKIPEKIDKIKLGSILNVVFPVVDIALFICACLFVILTIILSIIFKGNFQFKPLCIFISVLLPVLVCIIMIAFVVITAFLAIIALYMNTNLDSLVQTLADVAPTVLKHGSAYIPRLEAHANITNITLNFYTTPFEMKVKRPVTIISNLIKDEPGKSFSQLLDVQNALSFSQIIDYVKPFPNTFYSQIATELPKLYSGLYSEYLNNYIPENPYSVLGMPDLEKIYYKYEDLYKKEKNTDKPSSELIELKCLLTGDANSCSSSPNVKSTFVEQYKNLRTGIEKVINYLADSEQMPTNLKEISPKLLTTLQNVSTHIQNLFIAVPSILDHFPADFIPKIWGVLHNVLICDLTKFNTRITFSLIFSLSAYLILAVLISHQKLRMTKGDVSIEDPAYHLGKGDGTLLIPNSQV